MLPADRCRQPLENQRVIIGDKEPDPAFWRTLPDFSRRGFDFLWSRRGRLGWSLKPPFHNDVLILKTDAVKTGLCCGITSAEIIAGVSAGLRTLV
jgi:hypothetical protein